MALADSAIVQELRNATVSLPQMARSEKPGGVAAAPVQRRLRNL